jgi:ATP-dependent Clp protease ATP-binding subunit ClpA
MGFTQVKREGDDMAAIDRLFAPEFRNRLDAIVPFGDLPSDVVNQVVRKFVLQLEAQLSDRGVLFDLSDEAVEWLAKKGYDTRMGARPLARVIQEHIKQPLAEEVLFGKLKLGGTVRVTVVGDGDKELKLEILDDAPVRPKPEPTPRKKRARPRRRTAKKPLSSKRKGTDGRRSGLVPKVPLKAE